MATKPYDSTYEAGFKTVFKGRLTNVSDETTEEEIKNLYAEWADEYDEVMGHDVYATFIPRHKVVNI